jgi:hypothetical protein
MQNNTVKHGIRRLVVQIRHFVPGQTTHDNVTISVFAEDTDDDANISVEKRLS